MRQRRAGIGIALLAMHTAACGYLLSGTWEDDPDNWYRAFGEAKPAEVVLTRSRYTRYPHFTHEHAFYLEFQASRRFVDDMIATFGLTRATRASTRTQLIGEGPGIPDWFLPRPLEQYEVWIETGTLQGALLFVDKDSGAVYFTHTQL